MTSQDSISLPADRNSGVLAPRRADSRRRRSDNAAGATALNAQLANEAAESRLLSRGSHSNRREPQTCFDHSERSVRGPDQSVPACRPRAAVARPQRCRRRSNQRPIALPPAVAATAQRIPGSRRRHNRHRPQGPQQIERQDGRELSRSKYRRAAPIGSGQQIPVRHSRSNRPPDPG